MDPFKFGALNYNPYTSSNFNSRFNLSLPYSNLELQPFMALTQAPPSMRTNGNFRTSPVFPAIDYSAAGLHGFTRKPWDADQLVQASVMRMILDRSTDMLSSDPALRDFNSLKNAQAYLLALGQIESGFNPDAMNASTRASGVYQILRSTAALPVVALPFEDRFDARSNIDAGIRLFQFNLDKYAPKFFGLDQDSTAAMYYAYHHDRPALDQGGYEIAQSNLVPYLDQYREVVNQYWSVPQYSYQPSADDLDYGGLLCSDENLA